MVGEEYSKKIKLITVAAIALILLTRINPVWILTAGGVLGGLGFL
jgi:hypothetical protein